MPAARPYAKMRAASARMRFARIAPGPSGEIGRHSGLKIRRLPERGRTGSIPVSGTKKLFYPVSNHLKTRMVTGLAGFFRVWPFEAAA